MTIKKASPVSQASQSDTGHYTPSSHGAETMARLAKEIRRATFIGVSKPDDIQLLHDYLSGFDRLAAQRETMSTDDWLSECNRLRELAKRLGDRIASGFIELRGVI